jgi:hypothetical protein
VEAAALGNVAMQMLVSGCVGALNEARDVIAASHPPRGFEPSGTSEWDSVYRRFEDILQHRGTKTK